MEVRMGLVRIHPQRWSHSNHHGHPYHNQNRLQLYLDFYANDRII